MSPEDPSLRPDGEPDAERVPEDVAAPSGPPEASAAPSATVIEAEGGAGSRADDHVATLVAHTIDVPVLAAAVERQESADAADTLENLGDADAAEVLVAMDDVAAAGALAEMDEPLAVGMLHDLLDEDRSDYAGRLLSLMAVDDAADLLQAIDDDESRERLLTDMDALDARKVRRLLGYHEETAGGLMTTDFLSIGEGWTVDEATEALRAVAVADEVTHLPVVDARGRLTGVVSLRQLLLSHGDRVVGAIMERSPRAVHADLDQEDVAREFDRYDHSMMPVVDRADRVLGIVTVDDVIDIIREEQTEDVQRSVGAGKEEGVYSAVHEKVRGRAPWLLASVLMMIPSAVVVLRFERLIGELAILAMLMPVVAAVAGNAGHQALAVTLRGIVLGQVRAGRTVALVRREATAGLVSGLVIGTAVLLGVGLLSGAVESASWPLGIVAGTSVCLSITAGSLSGSLIPLVMRRLGADPAQSSAIFLIMITDAVAFASFLGLASLGAGLIGGGGHAG